MCSSDLGTSVPDKAAAPADNVPNTPAPLEAAAAISAIAFPTLPKDNCNATNTSDRDFIPPRSLATDDRHVGYFMVKLNKIYGRCVYGSNKMP